MIGEAGLILSSIFSLLNDSRNAVTAISTAFIALFTFTLWRSTRGLLKATNENVKLVTDEFISTHRPKIKVRQFRLTNDDLQGDIVEVHFTVVNRGSTKARIEQAEGIVYFRSPDSVIPYDFDTYQGQMPISQTVLPAGGIAKSKYARISVYVAGRIGYKDDIGITRTTAFLRELNASNHRFRVVDDDDYEYED